ncbi:hypothetical protein ACVW0J_003217 [Bradyrhizobium sp. i1.7.7]
MISGLADSVLVTFIVFCRIGACLMLVPGYSSVNVPAQVRLFVALVTTFALTPILISVLKPLTDNAAPLTLALLICSELVVGSVIGLGGRVFFLALQTMATVMAGAIGLSNIPGTPVGDTDPAPALVPLIMAAVTTLFFMTDQHWQVLRGLMNSYDVWQPGNRIGGSMALETARQPPVRGVRADAADHEPLHRLFGHRQPRGRPDQQADAGNSGLFHLGALRAVRRLPAALPHERRALDAIHAWRLVVAGGVMVMTSRADKLGRMVSLVKLQLRLSEWQLAHLRQQERSLQDEQEWLVGTLNEGKPPAGSSSDSIARRLNRTSAGARAVQAQASQQLDQVRADTRRVKQFEQVAKAALADKLRDAEARSLEEMTGISPAVRDWTPRPASRNKT